MTDLRKITNQTISMRIRFTEKKYKYLEKILLAISQELYRHEKN